MMYDHDQVVNANASEPPVAVACSFPLDQKWFPFELQLQVGRPDCVVKLRWSNMLIN